MSLRDLAAQPPPQAARRGAFPWSLREKLPADEFEALITLLDNPEWAATALSTLLRREGIGVSETTIRAYRRGASPDPDVES